MTHERDDDAEGNVGRDMWVIVKATTNEESQSLELFFIKIFPYKFDHTQSFLFIHELVHNHYPMAILKKTH